MSGERLPEASDHCQRALELTLDILGPLITAHPGNVETAFDLTRVRQGLAEVGTTNAERGVEQKMSGIAQP